MTTHNHASNAAPSAGHASMEVLTAAEGDAILGGRMPDFEDFLREARKYGKKAYDVGKKIVNGVKKVVDWVGDIF